jgi:hypothetical protein
LQEDLLNEPCTELKRYADIEALLLGLHDRGDEGQEELVEQLAKDDEQEGMMEQQGVVVLDGADEAENDARYAKQLVDYDSLARKVTIQSLMHRMTHDSHHQVHAVATRCPRYEQTEDPGALVFVYRRLYFYLGELSLPPKFLKKKGQTESEAFVDYEADNLWLMDVHLTDLRSDLFWDEIGIIHLFCGCLRRPMLMVLRQVQPLEPGFVGGAGGCAAQPCAPVPGLLPCFGAGSAHG